MLFRVIGTRPVPAGWLDAIGESEAHDRAAIEETVLHLNAGGLPLNRYLEAVTIPDAVWRAARTERIFNVPATMGVTSNSDAVPA